MRLLARLAVGAIGVYQAVVSPFLPRACRFAPSCSEYARQCIALHGIAFGAWLAVRRLIRCHPLNRGGYDPPPGSEQRVKA
jgi:putative membrane protein insertion efficiency factor